MVDNYLAIILVVLLITLFLIRARKNRKNVKYACATECTEGGCCFESPSGTFGTKSDCEETCKAAF